MSKGLFNYLKPITKRRSWSVLYFALFLFIFALSISFNQTPIALGNEQTIQSTRLNTFNILETSPSHPSAANKEELEDLIKSSLLKRQDHFIIHYQPGNLNFELLNSAMLNVLSNPANIDINLSINSYGFWHSSEDNVGYYATYTAPIPTDVVTALTKDQVVAQLIDAVTKAAPTISVKYTGQEALTLHDISQGFDDNLDTPGNDYIKARIKTSSMTLKEGYSKGNGVLFTASYTYVENKQPM